MARSKVAYVCRECGASAPKWLGRCATCGSWGSLEEARVGKTARASPSATSGVAPVALGDVRGEEARRLSTGLTELDRVLGGGPVAGGVVLVGGDPGIGKSTLLMQALAGMVRGGSRGLYVSGEESAAQIALRARRLGLAEGSELRLQPTNDLEDVEAALQQTTYDAVVLDSIQTLRSRELDAAAGSVGQLREVTARLVERAKQDGFALFLIGHVTKEGMLAGPKVLEHLVDTVLAFEGDDAQLFRLVRATKNRFGPAHEVGVFEMMQEGLREVADPSALFLAERRDSVAGSVVCPSAEGSRPLVVEVQALVAPALYGAPRRVGAGLDTSRLAILLAVLQRRAGVQVLDRDVFANIAGGARVDERALDLALAAAIVSGLRDRPLASGTVVFGEIGLAGEVRAAPRADARVQEARKLGFDRAVLPQANAERVDAPDGMRIVGVKTLEDALGDLFD